ncbi:titin isoform X5 [Sesamum indicum]|uniref:Titin isoform X5 n=1 Tax=Sesamum indicum TaxID=4182 RepID=A0A8M8VDS6_SESIN|nr:titin isoform X5 [Sesamum indicum]
MATEADIPATAILCETRKEQGGNIADAATNIMINKIPQEEKTQADTRNEPPTVEGDNFLGTPLIDKVHCEVSSISPDASMVAEKPDQTVKDDTEVLLPSKPKLGDQTLEITGSQEICSERIQQNAEESNDSEKGEDRGVLPVEYSMYSGEMTSGMQAGDILHDPDSDDLRVETQLSKDTTSDHHCVNDSIAKQMALSKENLQEASLLGGEKDFNIQVKETNDANGDGEKTEEDISLNLTSDVCKEECPNDQSKINPEQEGSDNEKRFAENLDRIAEKVSQENSTLADATSSSDKPLSKNESNSSFSQEDDTAVPTSEGSGILLENIVDESQVAVESQSRNLEGFVTTHGNTNITEKTEECSLVRVDGSEIQCDEQLEQESKELPVPEVLTGGTNDNESAIIDKVKDEDEDLEEAEMYGIEKNKRINQQKEEVQVEKPVESLNVAPENIEASNLGQDNKTSFQEEHRTDGDQQGMTSDNSEEKTIDTVDTKKETLENFSTIVSIPPEEGSIDANLQEVASDSTSKKLIDELDIQMEVLEKFSTVPNEQIEENSIMKVDDSEMKDEEHLENQIRKTSSPIPLAREASADESTAEQETRIEDGEKAELCENETSPENMKIEPKIENPENSLEVTSEDIKASSSSQEIETRDSGEEESIAANPQGILDEKTDKEKVGAAELKEEIPGVQSFSTKVSITPEEGSIDANLQKVTSDSTVEKMIDELDTQKEVLENFSTIISNEYIEENLTVKVDDSEIKSEEQLEKESITKSSPIHLAREASDDGSTVERETPIEDGEEADLRENETSIENMKIESKIEKPENSLDVISENIKASDSGHDIETRVSADEESLAANPQGILDENTDKEIVSAAEIEEENSELQNFAPTDSNEKTNESSLIQGDGLQKADEEHLEKESEKPSSKEDFKGNTNDDELTLMDDVKIEDETPRRSQLFEEKKNIENALLKEELQIEKPVESSNTTIEDFQVSDSGQHTEKTGFIEEQTVIENPQGNPDDVEEKTDTADADEKTRELQISLNVSDEDNDQSSLIQVDTSEMEHEEYLEREMEKPSPGEASTKDANDDKSTIRHEPTIGDEIIRKVELFETNKNIDSTLPEKEDFQDASEVHKASTSSENIESTSYLKEHSLTANLQAITSDKTIDATDAKENAAKTLPHEHTEGNSSIQLDCLHMKHGEHLDRECEIPPLLEAAIEETNKDKSKNTHEPYDGAEDPIKSELSENEKDAVSTLVKKEAHLEKPIDSLPVATEDIEATDSIQDIEVSSIKEQILSAARQEISVDKTEEKTIDAAETKEETPDGQIFETIVSNEKTNENPLIEGNGSQIKEYLEKESEKPSSIKDFTGAANDDELTQTDEHKIEDENQQRAEFFGNKRNTESTLLKEELKIEEPIESFNATVDDVKVSDLGQHTEKTGFMEEQRLIENPQGIQDYKVEEKTEGADTDEKTRELQNVLINVPNVDNDQTSLTQVDVSEMKHEEYLEKEMEISSLTEASTEDVNDDRSTIMHEAKIGVESIRKVESSEIEKNEDRTWLEKEDLQDALDASEVCKASASMENIQTTCYLEEQSLTSNLQAITSNKTIDATYAKEVTLENVAKSLSYEEAEENSTVQMEHEEHLETENEIPLLAEVPTQETNEYKSKNMHDEDQIKSELSEKGTVSTSVEEETNIEKPLHSLQVATKDIEATDSSQDIEIDSTKDQIQTADSQEISGDKAEDKTTNATDKEEKIEIQDIATNVPDGVNEDDSPIKETGSQKPFLEEESMGNLNNDEPIIIHETNFEDESSIKTNLSKDEHNIDFTSAKEEVSSESSQAAEKIKASASSQERETSSLEEQSLTENPQGIMGDYKEDETNHVIDMKEETPEDKDVASTLPYEDIEKSSPIQVDCSQKEHIVEKESDDPSVEKSSTGDTTGSTLVEEELGEKCIDSLQVATQEIKASGSGQDIETSSIEEQVLTTNQQETSNDRIEEKTIDTAYRNEETLEAQDIATNAPTGENDENSLLETDSSQKPFPIYSSKRNANGDESTLLQDAKFEDEVLSEHKKNTEGGVVNEEVHTESIRVAVLPEDIKASPLGQDRETCLLEEENLTPNPQGIKGDQKEDKTIDATDLKEETPEEMVKIMNITATSPRENTQIEADSSEMEYEEHLVKESENPSLAEALEKDTEESASVKEEAQMEKLIDSLEVVSKNIKAYDSNQVAEISSIKEQILTEDPREISGDKTEEKSIDANAMNEEILKNQNTVVSFQFLRQDLATNVPDRDNEVNSTIKVDGSQMPSVGEASTGNANDESKDSGPSSEVENKELEPDTELPKEIENADFKAKTMEFNEEEGYLKDLQMATAVNIAAHEELVSDSIAVKIPCTKSLDAKEEMVDLAEAPNYKQEESSITKELEEHLPISHEKVTNMTSLASEAPKLTGDYEVVAKAYNCSDKTDTEKAGELYDGSITITTNENPVETDKKESTDTETQAAKVKKEAELIQPDPEARTDQQDIEEDLPTKGSQDVSGSNEVTAEEKKRNSDNCEEISGSTTDVVLGDVSSSNVASEEVSTYNPYQESRRQIQQETGNKEAQKQEKTVCRQEKVMSDETVEEIKVSTSTTVASDFLPKSFKETSEVDHSATDRELTTDKEGLHEGKTASGNEETKTDTINKEEEASKHKVSDFSSAALEETFTGKFLGEANIFYETANTTQSTVEDILVSNRSIVDLKENSEDEAPKTTELTPTTTKGQELESTTVGEISMLISQGEGGKYEHAPSGSVTEEKLDSDEAELGHGENRSEYEPKNEVLESIAQVQNCDSVSEAEETRTCEENREATEIKRSNEVVAEDIFEPKETININMSSKKIKEDDEDVEDYLGSLEEEVITESHLQDEINTEELFEAIKKTNETEKVSKVLEEPDDKATEKTEENLVTNESIDRSLLGKCIEEVTTILDTEEADGIDHVNIKTGTEDSRKEENLILSASEGNEEAQTCIEAERLGFSSNTKHTSEVSRSDGDQDISEDNKNSTSKNEYFEEKYPNKSMESQMSAVSKDIELIEQVSKATKITLEMQETRGASDSGAEPEATGVDSQQMEEASHKCKEMAETSMSVEPTEVSTSKIFQEYVAETSLEAEDNLTTLHEFPQESHIMDSVVKIAQKDGPIDLQIVSDITDQDVQELNEGSIAMINKENPMEVDPNENIEIRCSADSIQKAPVLETLGEEMEEQQPGRTCEGVSKAKGLDCVEKKTIAHECNDLLEKSSSAVIETVSESNIYHCSAGDTAQTDKNKEGQLQIDFRPILLHPKCSETETAEKDLPVNLAGQYGTDEKELEGTPPPAKDKHVVLEADHTKNVNPDNSIGNKDTSVIEHGDSAEFSQGEGETLKPSGFEQDAANCGHDEMTKSRENSESKEIDKQSLADLLHVSIKETSKMADHSATEKEPTTHREDLHAEKPDEAEHEGTKTDEERDDEEESSEQQRADICSEAPVMVDVRDADAKVAHKKSHNILSGVGSKMKHSIAKVKKAITGKSSHSHQKPPSPK